MPGRRDEHHMDAVDADAAPLAAEAELLYELIAAGGDVGPVAAELAVCEMLKRPQHVLAPDVNDAIAELKRRRAQVLDSVPRHESTLPRLRTFQPCCCKRCTVAAWLHASGVAADPSGWLDREWQRISAAYRAKHA